MTIKIINKNVLPPKQYPAIRKKDYVKKIFKEIMLQLPCTCFSFLVVCGPGGGPLPVLLHS